MNTHASDREGHKLMYRSAVGVCIAAVALGLLAVPGARASQPVWRDDFTNASLDPAWFWLNENPDRWSRTDRPGYMRIDAAPYPTGGENLLLRSGAWGDFTIETHVLFGPSSNFQFAGLVLYQDRANFLQLGRAFCDLEEICVDNGIYFDNIRDGELVDGNFATGTPGVTDEAYLRLRLTRRSVTAFYSPDGQGWRQIGRHELPMSFRINAVGLASSQNYAEAEIAADFDYFSLTGVPRAWAPFVDLWRAIDYVDGSTIMVSILGPASGPFYITWMEDYFSFCNGGPGLAIGRGNLDPADRNVLAAHMRLRCFRTGATLEWDQVWRYRLAYDNLVSQDGGVETIWTRPGRLLVPHATFVAYVPGAVEGYDWPMGHTITLEIPDRGYTAQAVSEQRPGSPEGETRVLFELWKDEFFLQAGDHVLMTDDLIGLTKEVVVANVAVTAIDLEAKTVAGTCDAPCESLWVWLYDGEGQVPVITDGSWVATFAQLPPGAWGGATQSDVDGDGTSIDFQVPAVISVTSMQDVLDSGDGLCALREAIIAANTNAPSGDTPGECPAGTDMWEDAIVLEDGYYSLTIEGSDEDDAATGDLDVWDNSSTTDLILMVEGNGHATITQAASADDRVLDILGASVHIEGLTLAGGAADLGGGVRNTGTLILDGSEVSGNSASGGGGGLWSSGTLTVNATTVTGNSATWGGGIVNRPDGTLTVTGSTITGNVASEHGGGIVNRADGVATVDASTISDNSAVNDGGGGLYNEGSLTITNSAVSDNAASHDGGGIANTGMLTVDASTVSGNSGHGGGGISNWSGGTATIQNGSVIGGDPNAGEGNTATGSDGGGVINFGTLIVDNSSISGNLAPYGGGLANWGGAITLTNTTVSNNSASAKGGGIHNKDGGTITIEDDSLISGNTAAYDGGGINNWDGTIVLDNSTVSGNQAGENGGGIYSDGSATAQNGSELSGNMAARGGGVFNSPTGTATVDSSEVSGDAAIADGGGGLYNEGVLTITNSTVSGNTAGGSGGGINNRDGTVALTDSSVSGNAGRSGGGIFSWGGTLTLANSAVTGNTATRGGGLDNFLGSTASVTDTTIRDNSAIYSGGGVRNYGTMTLSGSTMTGNSATWGGGINNYGGLTIAASTLSGNSASDRGGGLFNVGTMTVTGSVLLANTSVGEGDAVYSWVETVHATSVTESCIVRNGDIAFFNEVSALQNATGNWWGDPTGPKHPSNPGGMGDSVSDGVDFSGYLTGAPDICRSP